MVEALPAGREAVVRAEIAGFAEETAVWPADQVELDWTWLYRDGTPAGTSELLCNAAAGLARPDRLTRAYVFAEVGVVAAVSELLSRAGFDAISAKAYWGRGKANASHGEPVRDRG
jgi:NADPH-dependent ferric siderophore reductase